MSVNKAPWVKAVKRTAAIAAAVLLAAAIALVVYVMVRSMRGEAAEVFGVSIVRVVTGSMEPSIHSGDYIIVKKTDPHTLAEGDIICFYSADREIYGKLNTHRIVKILEDGSFVTKGDSNNIEDSAPVTEDRIVGKYDGKAVFLRWINSFGSANKLILLAVFLIVTAVAVYEVKTIAAIARERRESSIAEEKERLMRQAIDEEKRKLYEQEQTGESENTDENP
ncbi:MAG: signal peptidase I [Ruminiclostridium sp.]